MKHEYLFTSLEKFEQVKEYLPDKVQRKIYKIENTESFVSVYSIEGEKKENTKILSKIDEEIRNIRLNLETLDYIDSTGLGVIIGILKRIKVEDKEIYIKSPKDNVKKIFSITGLDKIFKMEG